MAGAPLFPFGGPYRAWFASATASRELRRTPPFMPRSCRRLSAALRDTEHSPDVPAGSRVCLQAAVLDSGPIRYPDAVRATSRTASEARSRTCGTLVAVVAGGQRAISPRRVLSQG